MIRFFAGFYACLCLTLFVDGQLDATNPKGNFMCSKTFTLDYLVPTRKVACWVWGGL